MSKEFTKSYAINRIAELNEQIAEMTDNQNQTMRYLNRIRDENKQLKQQLEEKDKEIEHLKDAVNMCQSIKRYDIGEMLTENIKLKQNQTQLAIQELEKVKEWLEPKYFDYEQINYLTRIIDNQIKELKGEK